MKVEEGTTTVAEYGYDGAKRRLTADVDSTVVHFLYTFRWQIIEQHLDSSPDPERQFIWGPFYIDHLILRDRDNSNPANGTLDERIYSLQDEGWNVSSLTDANGNEIERVTYAPYGAASYFNGDWSSTSNDSQFDFTNSFGGIEVDSETRLYHFRNRYRHAELGLWITRDPLFYLDAPHLYLTARSNPIRLMDPMGLQAARPKTCTAKTCEECVDSGWKNHEVLAKLRSRMTRTLGWRKGCKPNIVCCDRDDKRAECEPCDVPRKFGNLKIGTQNISICAFRVLDYSGVRGSKRGKCTHLWETIAHELIHLHDQCLNFNRIPKDKCAQCVCDEIHAYTWSGQCISGSGDNPQGVWYEINRFSSVEECVIKSVIGSCDAFCVFVGKTDKEKEAIVRKYIENKTCRRSPLGEELP